MSLTASQVYRTHGDLIEHVLGSARAPPIPGAKACLPYRVGLTTTPSELRLSHTSSLSPKLTVAPANTQSWTRLKHHFQRQRQGS